MGGQVLKLKVMRKPEPHRISPLLLRALSQVGLGPKTPYTHLELWGRGANSYVMAVAGASCLNVSYGIKFADRDEARRWARVYAHKHGLDPEPRPCRHGRLAPPVTRRRE